MAGLFRFILSVSIPAVVIATAGSAQVNRRDSIETRNRALRAQITFEQVRRMHLPPSLQGSLVECEMRVGRFCQWNDTEHTEPPEPKPIGRARSKLIDALDKAAKRSPRDGWITGQRVRYLLEAGDTSSALRAAVECRSDRWWCDAVRGLVLHETGAGVAADSAFGLALAMMPESERCDWTDISMLLDAAQLKRYKAVGCGEREDIAARAWWLADPFHTIPGNDRQAEHYARLAMSRILKDTRAGYDARWDNDLRELVLRYGWARYWTRVPPSGITPNGGVISGHEAMPNFHFFPAVNRFDSITAVGNGAWNFKQRRSPERYAPKLASEFVEIRPQIALFRRGDSTLVVVAYDVSGDTAFRSVPVRSAVALAHDERARPIILETATNRGSFVALIDSTAHLLSLEILSAEKKKAARARRSVWLPPKTPDGLAVSDLLLFDPPAGDVSDLAQALPTAHGNLTVDAKRKLGLYWEIYGLAKTDSALPVSLTLTRVTERSLRRVAESIGLGRRSTPISIAWRESPSLGGIATRSVVLDLSLISRGKYVLKLDATPPGQRGVSTSRVIDVR